MVTTLSSACCIVCTVHVLSVLLHCVYVYCPVERTNLEYDVSALDEMFAVSRG